VRALLDAAGFKIVDVSTFDASDDFRNFQIIRAIAQAI